MAQLHQSVVTLRIHGDDLIPEAISHTLGASPTKSQTKGDRTILQNTGHVRIAKSGMWSLRAADREPEDMDGQIREILSKLTNDLSIWKSMKDKFKMDLFCGLFMRCSNEGLTVSADSLAALGERGIEMALDLYGGHELSDEPFEADDEGG